MARPGGLFFALGFLLVPALLGAAVELRDLGALLGLIHLGGGLPGLPLQLVQLGQAAAQGVPLLGIQGGHLLVKPLVLAALGVLLVLALKLRAVFAALFQRHGALFHQNLSGFAYLFGGQSHQTYAGQTHIGQHLTQFIYHGKNLLPVV